MESGKGDAYNVYDKRIDRANSELSKLIIGQTIITQKYIALYPVGQEAWTEFRRTGYPKVFPVVVNESSGGSVDTNIQIRRLPYPESESVQVTPADMPNAQRQFNGLHNSCLLYTSTVIGCFRPRWSSSAR